MVLALASLGQLYSIYNAYEGKLFVVRTDSDITETCINVSSFFSVFVKYTLIGGLEEPNEGHLHRKFPLEVLLGFESHYTLTKQS
jgi:hypothetical protein